MRRLLVLLLLALARFAEAEPNEGVVAELAPLVVSDSFELDLARPGSERAVEAVEKIIREKEAKDEAHDRAGIFEARLWRYLPIRLGLSDEREFFAPSYSSFAFRDAEVQLRASERHSLIER